MNNPTLRKILYVDSQQQLTSTNNVFTLSIDSDITDEYDMCSLISAQIPVSFYIIQTGSNVITLLEGVQSASVTIPPGNYSVYSFQVKLPFYITIIFLFTYLLYVSGVLLKQPQAKTLCNQAGHIQK